VADEQARRKNEFVVWPQGVTSSFDVIDEHASDQGASAQLFPALRDGLSLQGSFTGVQSPYGVKIIFRHQNYLLSSLFTKI
jgi:hypothetical protein